MGTSTDALLWWGLNEDGDDYELPEPVRKFALSLCKDEDDKDDLEHVLEKYLAGRFDIKIVHHCHSENAMYGLAVKASFLTAWRGHPQPIQGTMSRFDDAWQVHLKAAADAIGWPWSEPRWWIASYWG